MTINVNFSGQGIAPRAGADYILGKVTGGPPMAIEAQEIETLIRAKFPDAQITITDLAGDGNHWAA